MVLMMRNDEVVGCQKDGHSSIFCDDCQLTDSIACPASRPEKYYKPELDEQLPIHSYEQIAMQIARLVSEKQIRYGDSFGQSYKIFQVLYPNGVKPEDMKDFLTIVRVVDKLFRLSRGDQGDESAWTDIMGYALLSLGRK